MTTLWEVQPEKLQQWLNEGTTFLIDVREEDEYKRSHIEDALFFPLSEFDSDSIEEIHSKKVVFYCRGGRRSAAAALQWAADHHLDEVYHLLGGYRGWRKSILLKQSTLASTRPNIA